MSNATVSFPLNVTSLAGRRRTLVAPGDQFEPADHPGDAWEVEQIVLSRDGLVAELRRGRRVMHRGVDVLLDTDCWRPVR